MSLLSTSKILKGPVVVAQVAFARQALLLQALGIRGSSGASYKPNMLGRSYTSSGGRKTGCKLQSHDFERVISRILASVHLLHFCFCFGGMLQNSAEFCKLKGPFQKLSRGTKTHIALPLMHPDMSMIILRHERCGHGCEDTHAHSSFVH